MDKKAKELEGIIRSNIKSIKDNKNLSSLCDGLEELRKSMDSYDSVWTNTKDWLKRLFKFGKKKDLCIAQLIDIVNDFDKYKTEDKRKTINKLTELSKIKDRTFLEKIISVLRAS